MNYRNIISMLDAEIRNLEEARQVLEVKAVTVPTKRVMSSEARARIAEVQRKRWAAIKKANAVTPPKATQNAARKPPR